MKSNLRIILAAFAAVLYGNVVKAAAPGTFPHTVFVGGQAQHVQGLAYDSEKNCIYMSFTSRFLKVDMQGNILASVDRIQGHLGAMTFNPADRKVYASLECKDDEIGQGIAKVLDVKAVSRADSRFYIAIIDVDKMESIGVDPENNDVLRTVCVKKAVEDYAFSSGTGDGAYEHRYGCSGIDGVTIAPEIAPRKAALYSRNPQPAKMYLYVAYGIYGDIDRQDNDYQVIQRYDLDELDRCARPVVFGEAHVSGPAKPGKEYFVYTGNTNYGVQNMAYDPHTDCIFLAVYKGKKPQFPNYSLFALSIAQKPFKASLKGGRNSSRHLQLSLVEPIEPYFVNPSSDEASGITGWRFKWGSCGLCPLGQGLWYIAENARDKETRKESCTARLYRWTGKPDGPFKAVE
ncbi:MAG: hypothetical protein ACI3ZO_02030 [Candidatus Cryptobacteroides sp.]|nr:hypothetical protein [Bacteroidales bacterium]